MFSERVVVGPERSFSHTDLLEYMETLLRDSRLHQERNSDKSNYSWLKSRALDTPRCQELDDLKPLAEKMSSESCSVIAVKLDMLTEDVKPPHVILAAFKNLLEEQYSVQMFNDLKRAKGTKNGKNRRNKVHPELLPPGRQATVSFILNEL